MSDTQAMLEAVDSAAVAVFAFFGSRGQVIAVPVTPYSHEGRVIVTATLAYTRKAELVRQNPAVALLAGGMHCSGQAEVFSDVSGDFFVTHLLEHELRKYPPARALTKVPLHRKVFSWYFGRAVISFDAERIETRPGADAVTLVTEAGGRPSIRSLSSNYAALDSYVEFSTDAPDGQALVVAHRESEDMSDLRQMSVRGELRDGVFRERSRSGSLESAGSDSEWARRRRASKARKMMKDWPEMPV
ncbi:MAG: pyridoxamine 5'-phosphate oxidase family protein [Dehalococcoidia bacterium]